MYFFTVIQFIVIQYKSRNFYKEENSRILTSSRYCVRTGIFRVIRLEWLFVETIPFIGNILWEKVRKQIAIFTSNFIHFLSLNSENIRKYVAENVKTCRTEYDTCFFLQDFKCSLPWNKLGLKKFNATATSPTYCIVKS